MKMKVLSMFLIFFLAVTLSNCAPKPAPSPNPTSPPTNPTSQPTITPSPILTETTKTQGPWEGTWTLWTRTSMEKKKFTFTQSGNDLSGESEIIDNNQSTFTGKISDDSQAVTGSWKSTLGWEGVFAIRLLESGNQFNGNINGNEPCCGARNESEQPEDCILDWSGKWQIWLGEDLQQGEIQLEQKGNNVTVVLTIGQVESYSFAVRTSNNGRTLSGSMKVSGISGKGQIYMLDNMVQFTGNLMGIMQLCGARMGASRPEPCKSP